MAVKYDLTFYENWITERSNMDLLPLLDGLVGKKFRFRDNAADRKKNYQFHSPASTIEKISRWDENWISFFEGLPIYLSRIFNDEIKRYDRFLTFKIEMQGIFEENVDCAYIKLKIKPCKVEPKKVGGIEDGSEMTGYDIEFNELVSGEDTTIHSLMLVNPKRYYEWLETNMKNEYLSVVNDVINDEEQSEPFSTIRYLTDKLEQDIERAKRLTYQLY